METECTIVAIFPCKNGLTMNIVAYSVVIKLDRDTKPFHKLCFQPQFNDEFIQTLMNHTFHPSNNNYIIRLLL